jgi:hypothetical protein
MATEWNKAVKTAFKAGRKTNKHFTLKHAMFDAKKIYKKVGGSHSPVMKHGGKSRKNKKVCGGSGVEAKSVVPFSAEAGVANNASKL